VTMGLCGMLITGPNWFKKFSGDLITYVYEKNPYYPCVCNKMVTCGNVTVQHTFKLHVDDLMAAVDVAQINTNFKAWLNMKYGGHGGVKVMRGRIHEYLGMTLDFTKKGEVAVDMSDYVASMVDDSPFEIGSKAAHTPAAEDLFDHNDMSHLLSENQKREFHMIVAKGLFMCRRARPDIHTMIAVLYTRVQAPTDQDWEKLERLLKYLNGMSKERLVLKTDSLNVMKWYIDVSFATHLDFKSHTGVMMMFGSGAVQSLSRKQKLNMQSSTEEKLVAAANASTLFFGTQ